MKWDMKQNADGACFQMLRSIGILNYSFISI